MEEKQRSLHHLIVKHLDMHGDHWFFKNKHDFLKKNNYGLILMSTNIDEFSHLCAVFLSNITYHFLAYIIVNFS